MILWLICSVNAVLHCVCVYAVLSDQDQGLEVVCGPSFTQLSSSPSFLHPLAPTAPHHPQHCHLLSDPLTLLLPPSSAPILNPLFPFISTFLVPLYFAPPPPDLHLLSQGPCGTLKGWWGWWWCWWGWNSHSVSCLLVYWKPPRRSFLFVSPHLPPSSWRGWGVGRGGRLHVFATVSSTHLYAAPHAITPHMPPVFLCVFTACVCFSCCVCCLKATNINTNPKKNSTRN